MFDYGKIYGNLKDQDFAKAGLPFSWNPLTIQLAKVYFRLFGYPDIASQMRFRLVKKLAALKPKKELLDAGCGNGIYVHEFTREFNVHCLGTDGRQERVDLAQRINDCLGYDNKFKTVLLEKLDIRGQKFDAAICLEVLEHIEDDLAVLKGIYKCLNPNGQLIVTVPKKGTGLSHEQEEDPDFEPEPFEHVRSGYEADELEALAKKAGFRKVEVQPYFFFFSKTVTKLQQKLYKKKMVILNLLLSPLLTVIASFDDVYKFGPRGYIMVVRK